MKKYIAEFKKVYNWATKKHTWEVQGIYDENGNDIFIHGSIALTKEHIKYVTDNNDIKFKVITEKDFEISGNRLISYCNGENIDHLPDFLGK